LENQGGQLYAVTYVSGLGLIADAGQVPLDGLQVDVTTQGSLTGWSTSITPKKGKKNRAVVNFERPYLRLDQQQAQHRHRLYGF
jgi:hypothetical protein